MAGEASPAVPARPLLRTLPHVLAVALLVREALSFWTGHPYDFEIWLRTGRAVASGVNPYPQLLPPIPGVSIAYYDQNLPSAAYPPFWPLLLGGLYRLWEVVGFGNRFVLYFLVKQPTILADVTTVYLLHRVVVARSGDPQKGLRAATYWALFPYPILITAVWGQFDSFIVVLILAALVTAEPVRRNVLYGVGIFVKWLTVIFVPFEIFRERGLRRFAPALVIATPVLLTAVAFGIEGWSLTAFTRGGISESSGGGFGMNYAYVLSISQVYYRLDGVPYLYETVGYLWIPAVTAVGFWGARWARGGASGELRAFLLVVATFLALRFGLEEQYFLYLFALFVIDLVVEHPGRLGLYLVTILLATAYLVLNNDGLIRFLAPLSPDIYAYFTTADSSAVYGTLRFYGLLVLAVLVTVTLAQLLYVLVKDDPAPIPWPVAWVPALRRPRRGTPA